MPPALEFPPARDLLGGRNSNAMIWSRRSGANAKGRRARIGGDGNKAESLRRIRSRRDRRPSRHDHSRASEDFPMARAHMKSNATDDPSPLGFYNFAVSYHMAADLVAVGGLKATHPESVAMFLYYHAIELYLKSFYGCRAIQQNGCAKSGMIFRPCNRAQRSEAFRLEKSRKRSWLCSTGRFGAARATL